MATLTLSKTYDDAALLDAIDLSNWLTDLETFVNTTKLMDTNIQAASIDGGTQIKDATITAAKIASSNITTAKIADASITTSKILTDNVTTAKIADAAITTIKILADNVTSAKILAANVTTAKLATSSVTKAKREAANIAYSSSDSGAYSQALTSPIGSTTVTNLQVTITASGTRPIFVGLLPIATTFADASLVGIRTADFTGAGAFSASQTGAVILRFNRDGTNIYQTNLIVKITPSLSYQATAWSIDEHIGSLFTFDESAPAGALVYEFRVDDNPTFPTLAVDVRNYKLVAYEL